MGRINVKKLQEDLTILEEFYRKAQEDNQEIKKSLVMLETKIKQNEKRIAELVAIPQPTGES
jgi:hypothetical protein